MSNDPIFDKASFIKLIMSNIEHNSSTPDNAKEYLEGEGLDAEAIASSGIAKIKALQKSIEVQGSVKINTTLRANTDLPYTQQKKWTHKSVLQLIEESGNPDPLDEIRSRARKLVLRAFEMGWEGPPYSPIQLAELIGIDVAPNDSVVDARILQGKKGFQIQYNPFQRPTRINFSVSHEIAHTFFSDCGDAIRNREESPNENRQLEQLCNAAAAEIQLPYAIFSYDANNSSPSIEGLIELATKYKASLESVFIRYTEVIDMPCAVLIGIFQSDNKIIIDYHKTSRKFPVKLPDYFEIPGESNAYECTSPGWTSRELVNWNIFQGESYNLFAVGISPYRRDNKPRVGILILPTSSGNKTVESGKVILEYGDATKPRGTGKKIIAQVVNTSAAMGFGFGKSLAKNYPIVKEKLKEWHSNKAEFQLGNTNLVKVNESLYVLQMLAQKGIFPKGNEIPLRYDELRKCLISLRETATELNCSIHMNAIGSGNAGGDWNIIIGMIHDELVNYELKVNIYLLPGKPFNPNQKSNLTLFKDNSTWETGKLL